MSADATDFFVVNVLNNANGWLANERVNINIDNSLSVQENELENIAIYPNPASSNLNIVLSSQVRINSISILDIQGRLIKEITAIDSANRAQVNISNLATGAYFISIKSDNSKIVKRFIKK